PHRLRAAAFHRLLLKSGPVKRSRFCLHPRRKSWCAHNLRRPQPGRTSVASIRLFRSPRFTPPRFVSRAAWGGGRNESTFVSNQPTLRKPVKGVARRIPSVGAPFGDAS